MFYSCVKSQTDCIMATGSPGVKQIPAGEETSDECAGKKKSKFQTFKKFFGKRKKKEPPASSRDSNLKPSQSSSDVSTAEPQNIAFNSPSDLGSKGSMGNKALSHDSVFISEPASENTTDDRLSQETTPGKVKALQLQLQANIRVGSSPQVIAKKTGDDAGAVSEDDGLPQSPPEISTLHEVLTCSSGKSFRPVEHRSSLSLGGTDSEDEQLSSESLSRPVSPLSSILLPVDFNLPASTLGCLDNSAARHKIFLNPRRHRDRAKRSKIAGEVRAVREQLPRLSEEESSTEQLLEASPFDPSSEGLDNIFLKEQVPGISGDAEKLDIAEQPQRASRTPSEVTENVAALNKYSLEDTEIFSPNDENVSTPEHRKKEGGVGEDGIEEEKMVPYPEYGSTGDSEIQEHMTALSSNELDVTSEEVIESATCQTDTGLALVLISDTSEPNTHRNELASKDQEYSLKPENQSENKALARNIPLGADVTAASGNETNVIISETGLSIDSAQIQLLTSRTPAEREVALCDSLEHIALQITPVTTEDQQPSPQELSPKQAHPLDNREEAQSNLHQSILTVGSDLSTHSIQESIATPHKVAVENSSEDTVINLLDKSNPSMECICQVSANDFEAPSISVNSAVNDQIPVTCTQATKTSKETDDITKSQHKTTKTPVRFTIAPAWQRSLSGGSSAKEDTAARCAATSTIKAELFEKTTEEQTCLGRVRSASSPISSEDIDINTDIPRTPKKQCDSMSQSTELPFGVKLKRASSFSKHSDENVSNSQKSDSSVQQVSLVKDLQNSENAGKTLQIHLGPRKSSLIQCDLQEEKDLHRTKPEEPPKKNHTPKSLEKSINKPMTSATSEPVWVSMAKLKQKGFQEHPLAKEESATETAGTATVTGKVVNSEIEGFRKSGFISVVDQERSSHVAVSPTTADVGTAPPATTSAPALEKGPRQPPGLQPTLQSSAEPPWLSLAKKKAKAWSEMPQIVQ
ncbi:acrosomal protein KIAA1210 homolog isoform X1 [Pleurodeles waltl]|uniref:acrosomal protein KIAA1210 homolog isoform X1 n=2 Tax=Pleurodeles waltl TaxID=8319 RepID=UPI0037094622